MSKSIEAASRKALSGKKVVQCRTLGFKSYVVKDNVWSWCQILDYYLSKLALIFALGSHLPVPRCGFVSSVWAIVKLKSTLKCLIPPNASVVPWFWLSMPSVYNVPISKIFKNSLYIGKELVDLLLQFLLLHILRLTCCLTFGKRIAVTRNSESVNRTLQERNGETEPWSCSSRF